MSVRLEPSHFVVQNLNKLYSGSFFKEKFLSMLSIFLRSDSNPWFNDHEEFANYLKGLLNFDVNSACIGGGIKRNILLSAKLFDLQKFFDFIFFSISKVFICSQCSAESWVNFFAYFSYLDTINLEVFAICSPNEVSKLNANYDCVFLALNLKIAISWPYKCGH